MEMSSCHQRALCEGVSSVNLMHSNEARCPTISRCRNGIIQCYLLPSVADAAPTSYHSIPSGERRRISCRTMVASSTALQIYILVPSCCAFMTIRSSEMKMGPLVKCEERAERRGEGTRGQGERGDVVACQVLSLGAEFMRLFRT